MTGTCTLSFYWSRFKRKAAKLENGYISSSVLKNIGGICIGVKKTSKEYSLCQTFSLDQIEEVLIKLTKLILNIQWYILLFKPEYKESSAFKMVCPRYWTEDKFMNDVHICSGKF